MNIEEIYNSVKSPRYNFLKENKYLGNNIVLVGVGGSHAYGTEVKDSDLDIRGVATNTRRNILIREDFKQVVDTQTDSTIYSVEKIIKLWCECNPNTVELLGLKPEHYLYKSVVGEELLNNGHIFLSKKAIYSFGGFANSQLKRLENTIKSYAQRPEKDELEHNARRKKLSKHMMHSIRLYFMCFDILQQGKIITHREKEHDFLMDIRLGMYLNDANEPITAFYEIIMELQNKLQLLGGKTDLPDKVDMDRVESLLLRINEAIVCEGVQRSVV